MEMNIRSMTASTFCQTGPAWQYSDRHGALLDGEMDQLDSSARWRKNCSGSGKFPLAEITLPIRLGHP
jgi:hypothetical protein